MHPKPTKFNSPLRRRVFQLTAQQREFFGHLLAGHREAQSIDLDEQAKLLGLDLDGLAKLSLCRVPRRRCFAADLAAIARYTGVRVDVLAEIAGTRG